MESFKNSSTTCEIKYGNFKFESGYTLGEEILKNHKSDELTIYIANNTMTLGFLKILRTYKNKFKKIIIGVFGISEVLDMLLDNENYITCKVPNKEIAEKSFFILMEKIKNQNNESVKNKKIFYSTTILKKEMNSIGG